MSAPAEEDVRAEWALQFPDGHHEVLHTHPDGLPQIPGWASDYGTKLVRREVRRSPWVEVQR